MHKTALPIGIDDFKKIITENYYYVDKTLFIKELITDERIYYQVKQEMDIEKTRNIFSWVFCGI